MAVGYENGPAQNSLPDQNLHTAHLSEPALTRSRPHSKERLGKAQKRGQMSVCEPPPGRVLQRCGPFRPADAPPPARQNGPPLLGAASTQGPAQSGCGSDPTGWDQTIGRETPARYGEGDNGRDFYMGTTPSSTGGAVLRGFSYLQDLWVSVIIPEPSSDLWRNRFLKRNPELFFVITLKNCHLCLQNLMAKALYDNVPESPEELAFRKGDILTVIEQNTGGLEGWWLCSLHGRQGIAPGNRLKLLIGPMFEAQPSATAQSPPQSLQQTGTSGAQGLYKQPQGIYQVPAGQDIYQVPPRSTLAAESTHSKASPFHFPQLTTIYRGRLRNELGVSE
ncbi:hypothetical protein CCH79_00017857 [Gambusia affinis]|uniref:SH3 domain-containing protein n=1 Tax=Gambusia affinis TaxID=33528 RepID=A0A315V441_GAMAF|nr:hypothetical protein CCH79_00017857 [Gambusia affinis]